MKQHRIKRWVERNFSHIENDWIIKSYPGFRWRVRKNFLAWFGILICRSIGHKTSLLDIQMWHCKTCGRYGGDKFIKLPGRIKCWIGRHDYQGLSQNIGNKVVICCSRCGSVRTMKKAE